MNAPEEIAEDSNEGGEAELAPPDIATQIEAFVKGMDSLVMTFPLTMWIVDAANRGASDEMRRFIETKCQHVVIEAGRMKGELTPDIYPEYRGIRRKIERAETAGKKIAGSFVVSLVSQYDAFLGALMRVLFYLRPEMMNSSERSMTLKELSEFPSIDAAREFIIDKEVESVIRKSHTEQFDWMEKKFGIELRKGLESWPKFIEVTERRNLIVHCDCRVSSQYLAVCRVNGMRCEGIEVGVELPVNRKYFTDAYECILEIGVKLAQVLWRKLFPAELAAADANLNQVTLELLNLHRYRLAKELLDFAASVLTKWGSDADRRIHIMNRAQAHKWLGEEEACRKILDSEDWSAVENKFSLGLAVLRDDFDGAAQWMRKIGPNDSQVAEGYREWPIYKTFRKSVQFKTTYQELFGREFSGLPENQHDITLTLPVPTTKQEPPLLPEENAD